MTIVNMVGGGGSITEIPNSIFVNETWGLDDGFQYVTTTSTGANNEQTSCVPVHGRDGLVMKQSSTSARLVYGDMSGLSNNTTRTVSSDYSYLRSATYIDGHTYVVFINSQKASQIYDFSTGSTVDTFPVGTQVIIDPNTVIIYDSTSNSSKKGSNTSGEWIYEDVPFNPTYLQNIMIVGNHIMAGPSIYGYYDMDTFTYTELGATCYSTYLDGSDLYTVGASGRIYRNGAYWNSFPDGSDYYYGILAKNNNQVLAFRVPRSSYSSNGYIRAYDFSTGIYGDVMQIFGSGSSTSVMHGPQVYVAGTVFATADKWTYIFNNETSDKLWGLVLGNRTYFVLPY